MSSLSGIPLTSRKVWSWGYSLLITGEYPEQRSSFLTRIHCDNLALYIIIILYDNCVYKSVEY